MNKLITGRVFRVDVYGAKPSNTKQWKEDQSIADHARDDFNMSDVFDTEDDAPDPFGKVGRSLDDPAVRMVVPGGGVVGPNGPVNTQERIDELEDSDFDPETFELNNVSCPVCLGTGYVGGASLLGGWRKVLTPLDPEMVSGEGAIKTTKRPMSMEYATSVSWPVVLPRGASHMDSLTVWNGNRVAHASVMIDSTPITNNSVFLSFFDGKVHTVTLIAAEPIEFTHVEIQVGMSVEPTLIDFPKLQTGSDMNKLDGTSDTQVYASPKVPMVKRKDIIVESTYGKAFQVVDVSLMNDAERNTLGWEMNVRVVQQMELYNLLPRRKVKGGKPTSIARDNMTGQRRT